MRSPGVDESVRFSCGNKCCVERTQPVPPAINLRLGLSLEDCYLLVTIMGMERNFRAGRKAGQAGRHVFCSGLFGNQGDGSNAVAPVHNRHGSYPENMRIVHHVFSFNARLELPRYGPDGNLQVKKPLRVPVDDFLFDNGRQPRVIAEVPQIPGKLAIPSGMVFYHGPIALCQDYVVRSPKLTTGKPHRARPVLS